MYQEQQKPWGAEPANTVDTFEQLLNLCQNSIDHQGSYTIEQAQQIAALQAAKITKLRNRTSGRKSKHAARESHRLTRTNKTLPE